MKGCTSRSKDGLKFLCTSNMILKQIMAFSSLSIARMFITNRQRSATYGRRTYSKQTARQRSKQREQTRDTQRKHALGETERSGPRCLEACSESLKEHYEFSARRLRLVGADRFAKHWGKWKGRIIKLVAVPSDRHECNQYVGSVREVFGVKEFQ